MLNKLYPFIAALFLTLCFIQSCDKDDNGLNPPDDLPYVNLGKIPYPQLTDYQLFVGNPANFSLNERVLPYDLNTPLFSDYSQKWRFIYFPKNTTAVFDTTEVVQFPVGTVIVKDFHYRADLRNPQSAIRHIETRLLVRHADGWEGYDYIWNDEQTEATLSIVNKTVAVSWIDEQGANQAINYLIPNKNECKGCHHLNGKLELIGPKVRNLNRDYAYTDGTMNQLGKWSAMGYLQGLPNQIGSRLPVWNDPGSGSLNDRARAYLDVNCAHCHRPNGAADNSGVDLRYTQNIPAEYGICKSPVAAGAGSGNMDYDIVPGHPERSIMPYRMNSTEPDVAMPELLRTTIHTEAVQLIEAWIAAMPEGDC